MLFAGLLTAIASVVCGGAPSAGEALAGGALGICVIGICVLSKEMGVGDGALLMILGLALGIRRQISILFIALVLCAAAAAALCLMGRVKRRSRLPFVPFLLLGYLMTL